MYLGTADEGLDLPPMPDPVDRSFGLLDLRKRRPYMHSTHHFGYLPPACRSSSRVSIRHAAQIEPDPKLRNQRVKITLDRMHIAAYPKGHTHQLLLSFQARTQGEKREPACYALGCTVREGEGAACVGLPLFIGLETGSEGLTLKCTVIQVGAERDWSFVRACLGSGVLKEGLKLALPYPQAVGVLSEIVLGLSKNILERPKENEKIQDIHLGLDFSDMLTRFKLAEGTYVAVQAPPTTEVPWNWKEWDYDPNSGQILNRTSNRLLPYNYIMLSVSRCSAE